MIISKSLTHAVLAGRKTQIRRPVQPHRAQPDDPLGLDNYRRNRPVKNRQSRSLTRLYEPKVGGRHAIKTKQAQPPTCHVIITDVRQERLGKITFPNVRAEGHKTTAAFADDWMQRYDSGWPTADMLDGNLTDDDILARWRQRHADRLVWVLTFELDREDHDRYLAQQAGKAHPEQYVSSAAQGLSGDPEADERFGLEPPVVDELAQKRITERANQTFREQRQADFDEQLAALEGQLARVRAASASDPSEQSDIRIIERRIMALRRRRAAA